MEKELRNKIQNIQVERNDYSHTKRGHGSRNHMGGTGQRHNGGMNHSCW